MANNEEPKMISERVVELISAEETSSLISDICEKNDLEDEKKIEDVAYRIGLVLLGKLPPDSLANSLEREVGMEAELANNIAQEINQSVFSQIKEELSEFYEANPEKEEEPQREPQPLPRETADQEKETKQPPKGKDTYREKVE
jgi:hypothetical protein